MNGPSFCRNAFCFCSAVGIALALGGCASSRSIDDAQTDAQACEALRKVIAQADSNFETLKVGAGVSDYDHTRWDTQPIFSGAHCDVMAWGGGKSDYACTWSKADAKEARNDYMNGIETAKTCLGPTWKSAAIPGVTGEGMRFSKPGASSVVDIRISQERAPARTWLTILTVGDPINRNAR